MRTILNSIILLFIVFIATTAQAQHKIEIGITGGATRFYPEASLYVNGLNSSMDNGWGWSAGTFIENHWKPKIHEIFELNYYNFKSDIFLEKLPDAPWSPYDGTDREPVYGSFHQTTFGYITFSGGIKYFLNKKLFVYPGFELAYSLNEDVFLNKTTYHLKLGAGVNFKHVAVLLEYAYGLRHQNRIFDPTVPFITSHRNKYLQLKAQVPLHRLR